MIVVLFGQPNCGKTTLANELAKYTSVINIDGDELRTLFKNNDYTKKGRIKNLNRASDIAHFINSISTENIILSLIYPYKEARDYLNSLISDVKWIYLTYSNDRGRENFHVKDFDVPKDENILSLNTSNLSVEECKNNIITYINEFN